MKTKIRVQLKQYLHSRQASVFAKGFNLRESYGSIKRPDKQGTATTFHHHSKEH
jgi:hypothetical protein